MSETNEHAAHLLEAADVVFEDGMTRVASRMRKAAAEIERLQSVVNVQRFDRDSLALQLRRFEWLPIADAPRDGTRVELWCERTEDIETQTVARFPAYGQYEVVEGDGIWLCNRGYPLCPTHWRPEPAGPESKPDQETKGER